MTELTGTQKKYLRGLAHHQKPVVQLGKNGLTEPVLQSIDEALDIHELIKVRLGAPEEKKAIAQEIADRTGSSRVGLVGHVVTLYRRQPDPEKRTIEL